MAMDDPAHVLGVAVVPKTENDQQKMTTALACLTQEDLPFHVSTNRESGQTIIHSISELNLEIIVDRLMREFKVEANVGAPEVAYRETITKTVEHDYTHKKQTGGVGQYGRVKIRFEPLPAGSGFEFKNAVVGGAMPKKYVPGVEKGLNWARETGVIAGFPVIDFKATLIDGAYHDADSNALTFDIAARACFREGIAKAGPKLLEPVMKVEVVTPEEYMGDVIGDLNSRRGQVMDMESRGNARVINAMAPLAGLFGYINTVRAMTEGRRDVFISMTFDHYEQVPLAAPDDPNFPGTAAMRVA